MAERRSGARLVPSMAVLILLTGIAQYATDMYLAAMPAMGRSLHASPATVQLTLTGFLIGVALGQLTIGPVSDSTGRRGFLLAGAAVFTAASIACAVAPTGPVLVTARVVQGMAAAAGIVCGRAVIADHFRGAAAARRLAVVTAAGLVGPVVAPMLGGLVLTVASWRAIFGGLTAVGAVMVAGVLWRMPETLPPARRHAGTPTATLRRMGTLLTTRAFRRSLTTSCLAMAALFSYVASSAFVLEHAFGASESTYSVVFASNAVAMVATSIAFASLVGRVDARRLRTIGLCLTTGSCAAFLVTGASGTHRLLWAWIPLFGLTAGMGLVLPASITLVQDAGRAFAGTAAALQGGAHFLCGALVSPLTGLLGTGSAVPMAGLMMAFMTGAVLTCLPPDRTARTDRSLEPEAEPATAA